MRSSRYWARRQPLGPKPPQPSATPSDVARHGLSTHVPGTAWILVIWGDDFEEKHPRDCQAPDSRLTPLSEPMPESAEARGLFFVAC